LTPGEAREPTCSTFVSSTPAPPGADVEMTPVVALPVGELKEGQIYHLVVSKLVVYDQADLSTDQASSNPPPEAPLTSKSTNEQQKSYTDIAGDELIASTASTGLEESLAKLSTSSGEISQGHVVIRNLKETGGQLAAGFLGAEPGPVQASPQETPAEKRKRRRKAAKVAKAAKPILAAEASNSTKDARVVVSIWGSPKNTGMVSQKPSSIGRQKTPKVGQGPTVKQRHLRDAKALRVKTSKMSLYFCTGSIVW